MKEKLKTLSSLLLLTTASVHIFNRITDYRYRSDDLLKEDSDQYYQTRFGKLRYQKFGTGKPYLLIHGLDTGSSSYEYYKIKEKLAIANSVYIIDLPGYGLSDKPEITFTNFFYVQLLEDFIKNVIADKTNIVTSGDSSTIGLMESLLHPELVEKLFLINPQNIFDMNQIPSNKSTILQTIFELPVFGTFLYFLYNQKEKIQDKFLEEYFYDPAKISKKDVDAYMQSAYHGGYGCKYSFASHHNKYTNINFLNALRKNECAITILAGSDVKDIRTNIENYKYYNQTIQSHFIPNTKKLPQLENPDEVIRQLTK